MKTSKFPDDVYKEAYSAVITDQMLEERPLVTGYTIDSEESKDLDDGVNLVKINPIEKSHSERSEESGIHGQSGFFTTLRSVQNDALNKTEFENCYLLQVSIADVASVVAPETSLFRESMGRVATRYLRNYNHPMIPRILSEDRLSLHENTIRPALTFDIIITLDGDIQDVSIRETKFKNTRKLHYSLFDDIIKNRKDDADFNTLSEMSAIAQLLMERRRQKGALAIYDLKRMVYTTEEGFLVPLDSERAHIGNIVVQEFMILANKAVAAFFAEKGIPILFRNHTVRQNIPGREEILEQINTALLHPQYIESLSQRAHLWFNRATYEPILLGHYGLNEAAYSHVTSPIRRVPDMINQHIIKSYLNNRELPFDFENLSEMSSSINSVMLDIKDEKSRVFIEKQHWVARLNLNYSTAVELLALDTRDFKKALKEAAKQDLLIENLNTALQRLFEDHKVDINYLYIILLETKPESRIWHNLRIKSLEYIFTEAGLSIQLINFLQQNGAIINYKTDFKIADIGFAARIIADVPSRHSEHSLPERSVSAKTGEESSEDIHTLKGVDDDNRHYEFSTPLPSVQNDVTPALVPKLPPGNVPESEGNYEMTTPFFAEGKTKKEAQHKAGYYFIYHFINHSLIPVSKAEYFIEVEAGMIGTVINVAHPAETLALAQTSQLETEQFEENNVGILLELCQKYKDWQMPVFDFKITGPAHSVSIVCEGSLIITGMKFSGSAESSNKKFAKQLVCRQILEQIEKYKRENAAVAEPISYPRFRDDAFGNENKSTLQESIPKLVFGNEVAHVIENENEKAVENKYSRGFRIAELIGGKGQVKLESDDKIDERLYEPENYVGLVNDYFQKHRLPMPKYNYTQIGTMLKPEFECKMLTKIKDEIYEYSGKGATKKDAKQEAAQKCYIFLSKIEIKSYSD